MPTRYPIIGDLDKPFHLPECECLYCEAWREAAYARRDAEAAAEPDTPLVVED